MRLFKRPSTSPQLVSATPIRQDVAASKTLAENAVPIRETAITQSNEEQCHRKANNDADVATENTLQPTSSSFSARKGISTWGRKVGRRWDQLKRSESTELLSVSGRRRRWSPNRKSLAGANEDKEKCRTEGSLGASLTKPKRISRVESLRNLFRANDRTGNGHGNSETSARNVTIEEEDDLASLSHYKMDKALSEGALRNVFRLSAGDCRAERLNEKRKLISESIQSFQEQQRVFDYILKNQEMLKTTEGMSFARETLDKAHSGIPTNANSTDDDGISGNVNANKNEPSTRNLDAGKPSVKRNLFNVRTNIADNERTEYRRSFVGANLEDLMSTMRLGCDESGYDSDSTRAGADSPDCEQAIPSMLKRRSFSITSDDYQGIDLSLPEIIPKKISSSTINREIPECCNASINDADSTYDESVRTDTTLMSDDDGGDTDSCDDDTFSDFTSYRFAQNFPPLNVEKITEQPAMPNRNAKKCNPTRSIVNDETIAKARLERTPTKRPNPPTNLDSMSLSQRLRLQNFQKDKKTQIALKGRKVSNASVLNLLENAASPSKDSPPATKIRPTASFANHVNYYSPKRSRSKLGFDDNDVTVANPTKRPPVETNFVVPSAPSSSTKNLARRELKTTKLTIPKFGNLGISLEKREAVRPYYVVSKLDPNGEAGKSKLIRVGDEVVRVSGRRLRGMSMAEARTALKNCSGTIELQIAREPTFNFDGELGDTWGEPMTRTTSDSAVWTLEGNSGERRTNVDDETRKNCRVVGALTKDGKSVSMHAMPVGEMEIDGKSKVTGMRKFQVMRKRNSMPAMRPGRTGSLSVDLLTIILEKGTTKKLGFSIVGGSDSNKGSMGIFVKDVMEGGQAAEEGTLRPGDEIFAINGQTMDGLTHAKALQYFKAAKPGKLILHVGRRDPTHKRLTTKR